MGILNITPDSFSDGGHFLSPNAALTHARQMVAEGAAIIDVGGESTRPGAQAVSVAQELDRVIPVIEALRRELPLPISIDTSKSEVMQAAVAAGAGMINDVRALRGEGALVMAAQLNREQSVPVCLMHMQGEPGNMQQNPHYQDVVAEVKTFLAGRIKACVEAGIPHDRLLIDPGFGFGKALVHNLRLLKQLNSLSELGVPMLVGLSRKRMIGELLNATTIEQRLYGSLALATLAAWQGAAIIRAHDVRATVEALKICAAVQHYD
ncbi:MAG TPA: dihydropteroate synthase [Gammaproteobacteria bacterium]|nr:dihydropteroate synthase [Gammaproteobacteria bacterium]